MSNFASNFASNIPRIHYSYSLPSSSPRVRGPLILFHTHFKSLFPLFLRSYEDPGDNFQTGLPGEDPLSDHQDIQPSSEFEERDREIWRGKRKIWDEFDGMYLCYVLRDGLGGGEDRVNVRKGKEGKERLRGIACSLATLARNLSTWD